MLAKPRFSTTENVFQVYDVHYHYGWPRVGHLAAKAYGASPEPSFFGCWILDATLLRELLQREPSV